MNYVLENAKGEVIRSFRADSPVIHILHRQDTGRVELASDLTRYEEIPYVQLGQTTAEKLKSKAVELPGGRRLRLAGGDSNFTPTHELRDDEDTQGFFMKWATIGHVAMLAMILSMDFTYEYLTKEEPEVVHVVQQIKRPTPRPVVTPSKTKVTKKVAKTVAPKKTKTIKKPKATTVAKSKAPRRAKAQARHNSDQGRSQNVRQMGALGVLGGHSANARGSGSGLDLSKASGSGSGRGSRGARGGHAKALQGSGIVGANMGSGAQAQGGGGYGTKGKAGGSAGYGKHSLIGSSSGYFQPLSSEALVEGGLDEDQITSVIMRNRGQIAACYERGLQTSPELRGRVSVRFVIGAAGQVSAANVNHSSLRSSQVEGCIVNRLRGWRFPKPVGGVNVKVVYPFQLNRVS